MARVPRRAAARARTFRAPDRRLAQRCSCSAWRSRSADSCSTRRRSFIAAHLLGFVPKEKLPTYNVFYEARTFSHGGPEACARRGRRPARATTSSASTSASSPSRCARTRGRPTARCAAAATPAPSSSSTCPSSPYRVGIDEHAPRDARHARRRQPDRAHLRQRASAARTGSFSTAAASSSRTAASCWRRRASARAGRRRLSISTAPAGCAWRTPPGAPTARTSGCSVSTSPCSPAQAARRIASRLAYPAPRRRELLPARPRETAHVDPRDAALDDLFDALALGVSELLREDAARFKSLGIALSGGRDSMLTLLVAWRAAALDQRARREAGRAHHRVLHAEPSLAGDDADGRAHAGRGARRRAARRSRSTRPPTASSRRRATCSRRGEP